MIRATWNLRVGSALLNGAGLALAVFLLASVAACGSAATLPLIADLSTPRVGHTSTLLTDGRVVVIGGADKDGPMAAVAVLDPSDGSWSVSEDLPNPRAFHSATLLADGRILVAGGIGIECCSGVTEVDLFDPDSGTWSSANRMSGAPPQAVSILLADGRVLVTGPSGGYFGIAQVYDPAADLWTDVSPMGHERSGYTATLLPDGRVLVAGGLETSDDAENSRTAEIFDPTTSEWKAVPLMAKGRALHSAVLLDDGRVFVSGGAGIWLGAYGGEMASAEIFDPKTDRWTTVTTACNARFGHESVLLPDGSVLLLGGETERETVDQVERFYPNTNTWRAYSDWSLNRIAHNALSLPDGTVGVIGGNSTATWDMSVHGENPVFHNTVVRIHPEDVEWTGCESFVPTPTPP